VLVHVWQRVDGQGWRARVEFQGDSGRGRNASHDEEEKGADGVPTEEGNVDDQST
jgi:hypothetical protein